MKRLNNLPLIGLALFLVALLFIQMPSYGQDDDTVLPSDQEEISGDNTSTNSDAPTALEAGTDQGAATTAGATGATAANTGTDTGTKAATPAAVTDGLGDFFKNFVSIMKGILDSFAKFLADIFGSTDVTGTNTTDNTGANTGDNTGDNTGTNNGGNTGTTGAADGSEQQRIVQEANNLVDKPFDYDPATNGGRKGCAQVVTTALKAAGVVGRVVLGVLDAISDLKNKGWQEVDVPPFAAGDVITWKTYDRNGDGAKDEDTHIGIIMESGNSVQAMSNSSSQLMPRLTSATYVPISRVLRNT